VIRVKEPSQLVIGGRRFWADGSDILVPVIGGGAFMLPDEGLDLWLGQFPKNDTRLTSCYLCLFTSHTASTVITHAQTMADITETVFTNYARQALATATWGALAEYSTTLGRMTTYPQVTFPTVGATGATLNGAFISDILSTTGDKAIAMANFTDLTAVTVAQNDIVKVTPSLVLLH